MQIYIIIQYLPDFLKAALETLKIAFFSACIALFLGLVLATVNQAKIRLLSMIIDAYTIIMRSTPLLVQLYFIYYGLPLLGIQVNPYVSSVIAFSLNTGAYVVEIFRGGLEGIDKGQFYAAYSLGMGWFACLRYIIFPQVLQRVIAPLLSQFSYLIKDTSLAAVLVVQELTYTYRNVSSSTYRPMEALVIPMIIYFLLYIVFRLASMSFETKKASRG
ncbi:amino acid ABC transporter permease [Sediminispirochaeta smaragdinae]|jgi:His/Glu/Gln/Arg/opine family amino acid ABC transporter permease subunit|uniref:Polar amino acid ABC transporter, inner membrane subunit n=1 Tax=Sediminispirochaeta smaragdinae (strain DSM 11293 / JCM 15392 / SEBR 4228) TaxID=573413 RepID=E1R458_SEDSS|nr:amino acid ABC transporter permease [Sediminispirochaeta smaragdinae]ADK80480.1 polar amino acid ABC transporter, inner membrane subunit [Sediminispirochaeta smaragdinae DSM 11293]